MGSVPTDGGRPPPPRILGRWGKQLCQTNVSLTPEKTDTSPETPLFPVGVTGNRTQAGPDTPRHRPQHPGLGAETPLGPQKGLPGALQASLRASVQACRTMCALPGSPACPGHDGRRRRRGKQKRRPRPRLPAPDDESNVPFMGREPGGGGQSREGWEATGSRPFCSPATHLPLAEREASTRRPWAKV